jgi:hypothetical protein
MLDVAQLVLLSSLLIFLIFKKYMSSTKRVGKEFKIRSEDSTVF